jgi:cobaltochelatase CobN
MQNMSPAMQAMVDKVAEAGMLSKQDKDFSRTVLEVERTIRNVNNYRTALLTSPNIEIASMLNALRGGYTAPSPGGDVISNPNAVPTGRNLYGINAETCPTEQAWEKGKELAENTIRLYRERHHDSIPRKVSYTLWSSEFIETGGATIAQCLYLLGVEPIRDAFGRVSDIRLIPSKELGRPRIDVVVQTSGQLRDLAASRLFLITRAVEMAAQAEDKEHPNLVAQGVKEAERVLVEKGLSPKEAREVSTHRVFGGVNGNYGTGIQGMTMASDRWENESELAEVYLNNMGAYYGKEDQWEDMRQYAFEAALANTDAVIQPRQSNTWGALSLDHVYEFMGGMNMAVRNVTGKEPDAYLSDYRNRNHAKMQEVKEAIGVESRTTLFNPTYIKEKMQGGASDANTFAELVQNTYGWNVMKPEAIDNEMWDGIYDTYVKDQYNLGTRTFFEQKNPAALQEMTAVMMESARKGYWKASDAQLKDIAQLHTELVKKYGASGSQMVSDNQKLQDFIAKRVDAAEAKAYQQQINEVRHEQVSNQSSQVLKKEEMSSANTTTTIVNSVAVVAIAIVFIILIALLVRRRRQNMSE